MLKYPFIMTISSLPKEKLRNVAIIAHVDHGKTTLVDAFLKQTHLFRENQKEMSETRILDAGELEREKGITINAKNTSIRYKGYKINIIDTPGHADFGGEVERTLNMADSCLLLVSADDGVMPQTKFVLKKALELGLKPIVVINKIDKKLANVKKTLDKVQDLFLNLATDMDQLNFPVYYAIAREGKIFKELPQGDLTKANTLEGDVFPVLDEIIENMPVPQGDEDTPFQMQITSLEYNPHLGRYLIGRIKRGSIKPEDSVLLVSSTDENLKVKGRIIKVLIKEGLVWEEVNNASVGEIIAVAGIETTMIGATLCNIDNPEALPEIKITPPSVRIKIEPNTSPFLGKEGKFVTAKQLQQRLEQEKDLNISLDIKKGVGSSYYVSGRGELQLSIFIEQMRREGYEFQLSKPEVILQEQNGVKMEPMEELTIHTPEEYISAVTQEVGSRRGNLIDIETDNGQTSFTYKMLTRDLLGLRRILMNATKGTVVMSSFVSEYIPYIKHEELFRKGVLISSIEGTTLGYALTTIQERGKMFVGPSVDVYEGMIVGMNNDEGDIVVNPCKERHKTNVRMSHAEVTEIYIKAVLPVTIEFALSFIQDDELIEVTPKNIRLRKKLLTETERNWSKRKNLTAYAKQQLGIKD